MLDGILQALSNLGRSVLDFLPRSPFRTYLEWSIDIQYLRWLNWLVPVGQMIPILTTWLTAISVWYVYQLALRWAKAIE